jgi:hypothetical protein
MTISEHNSFVVLAVEEIANGMGVALPPDNFEKVDLLKDLELARFSLLNKTKVVVPDIEVVQNESLEESVGNVPLHEWLEDDSENEKFTLVQSKKKKKKTSEGPVGTSNMRDSY